MTLCPRTSIFSVLNRVEATYSDAELTDMFYDWFCKESSLPNKGRKLLRRLRQITPSPRFDGNENYVFFKNNCPMNGSLYDDFRICDIKTGDVVYCVTPAEGYKRTKGEACVWGKVPYTNDFDELVRGTWDDVKKFFRAQTLDEALEIVKATRRLNMIREAEYENSQFDADARWAKLEAERAVEDESREYRDQLSHLIGEEVC